MKLIALSYTCLKESGKKQLVSHLKNPLVKICNIFGHAEGTFELGYTVKVL